HFLDIVRRQPGGLWPDKIVEVSPGSSGSRPQESAIVRRQRSAAPALRRAIDHHHCHRKERPQKKKRTHGYHRRCSPPGYAGEKEHAYNGDPKPVENKLP